MRQPHDDTARPNALRSVVISTQNVSIGSPIVFIASLGVVAARLCKVNACPGVEIASPNLFMNRLTSFKTRKEVFGG
jgi:hypothetical protein